MKFKFKNETLKFLMGGLLLVMAVVISSDVTSTSLFYKEDVVLKDYEINSHEKDLTFSFSNEEIGEERQRVSIYLNPSVQTWNPYIDNLGNEAQHMNAIAEIMFAKLQKYHYIDVSANLNNLSLSNSVKESNAILPDIHFALHSNAGGGSGSEIYTKNDHSFATHVLNNFVSESPFPSRGVKNGNHLYEVQSSKARHVALIEILFHDNKEEASYIANNHEKIASNLVASIISYIDDYYN